MGSVVETQVLETQPLIRAGKTAPIEVTEIVETPPPLKSTAYLTELPLFQPRHSVARHEAYELSYERAKLINKHWGLTIDDTLSLSPKFWAMHRDGIILNDLGAHAMLSIQHNLVAGTLARYAHGNAALEKVLQDVVNFKVSAGFMLTELGHGLDAKNLETTVRQLSDGSFVLNTPSRAATKFVPPSMPVAGLPRIAVVIARLLIGDEDRGIRPVLVALGNGSEMCCGVKSVLLPELSGIQSPYAMTSFDHVHLPADAVLGSLDMPQDKRVHFFDVIERIPTGTLALSMIMIPALKLVTHVAGKYSLRRHVGTPGKTLIPIIKFRTQQAPVCEALARLACMEPFADEMIKQYTDTSLQAEVRGGFTVILKAVFLHYAQDSMPKLIERCGAQALFKHNQICDADNLVRAAAISEGDALVLCIRLAVEICLGKYAMPEAKNPECLLAQYEMGLAEEALNIIEAIPEGHRSDMFNRMLIPRCRPIVEAIGNRMVYEAAVAAGVDSDLLSLFEISCVKENLSWYIENGRLDRKKVHDIESAALDSIDTRIDSILDKLEFAPYVTAPIISDQLWEKFAPELETFQGHAKYDLFGTNLASSSGDQNIFTSC